MSEITLTYTRTISTDGAMYENACALAHDACKNDDDTYQYGLRVLRELAMMFQGRASTDEYIRVSVQTEAESYEVDLYDGSVIALNVDEEPADTEPVGSDVEENIDHVTVKYDKRLDPPCVTVNDVVDAVWGDFVEGRDPKEYTIRFNGRAYLVVEDVAVELVDDV